MGFVDSDDYIEPDMFRRLYDAAVESGAQIAYGDLIYEEEGTPQPAEPAGPVTVRMPDEVLCDLLLDSFFDVRNQIRTIGIKIFQLNDDRQFLIFIIPFYQSQNQVMHQHRFTKSTSTCNDDKLLPKG